MSDTADLLARTVAQHEVGDLTAAEAGYRQILAGEPSHPDAWHLLGLILRQRGELESAIGHIGRAIELRPEFADPYYNLGCIWTELGRWREAVQCHQRAVQLKPDFAEAYCNLGVALGLLDCREEAIACYRQALHLKPNYAEAHHNLARALQELGRYDEALEHFEEAVRVWPDLAEVHVGLAALLLLRGDSQRGWEEYEWRWKTGQLPPRNFSEPLWEGEPLAGCTILLHAEQGLGDTLQFVRYAPLVKALGARVIVECQRALVPLVSRCAGIDRLVARGDALPSFDYQAPMISLPRAFQTTIESVPGNVPYLFADPLLVQEWHARLQALVGTAHPTLLVGIHWEGRPGPGSFVNRNIPLRCFLPLAQLPGVRLVRLQRDAAADELAELAGPLKLVDPGDLDSAHGAFMDSAAIIQNLDLVITCDTAMAHLAGGLGAATWVALPFSPEFRWLLNRRDSPWYPTMRLFRQPRLGDWESVFGEIRRALTDRFEIVPVQAAE